MTHCEITMSRRQHLKLLGYGALALGSGAGGYALWRAANPGDPNAVTFTIREEKLPPLETITLTPMGSYLIATSCRCHGVIDGLRWEQVAGS